MKLLTIWLTIFQISCLQGYPQSIENAKIKSKLELIESIKNYCINELNMNLYPSFYKRWAESEIGYHVLYVSKMDTLIGALEKQKYSIYFGHNLEEANYEKEYHDLIGNSTLLYRTYGTVATQLSNHFLSYPDESIAFIAFHEAAHQHIGSRLPYSIVESVCDVVGNYGSLNLFSKMENLSKRNAKKQLNRIESISLEIYRLINHVKFKNINELQNESAQLRNKIGRLDRVKHEFIIDRYDYEINNAYLLRNKDYTKHYFKLKTLLTLTNDLEEFIVFITKLPSDESECVRQINNEIETLTNP